MSTPTVRAVIWDFDGTLVDTRDKNLAVNRRIVETVTGRPWTGFPILASQEAYQAALLRTRNWQDLYLEHFGLDEVDMAHAGGLWTEAQLADTTPTTVFDGIAETIAALDHLPHGIVSQNSRENIEHTLERAGLLSRFATIIGFEEVPHHCQKPDPTGLIACLRSLVNGTRGTALYVGDHATDMECAFRANTVLTEANDPLRVAAVAACFDTAPCGEHWDHEPAFVARHPTDLVAIAGTS